MASNAGAVVTLIKSWSTNPGLDDEAVWGLMDEVIDDVMSSFDPWFSFNYAQVARTATNHFNDSGIIPPAYAGGVLAVDADIESGATVPDNSEYLRAFVFPTGLEKPIKVYYGSLTNNVELDYVGWEEFEDRYPNTTSSSGTDPKVWTIYNGAILVGPHPGLTATLSIYGTYRPAAITSNADTNAFIREAAPILRYGVMRKLIIYDYEEDSGRFPAIERQYMDLCSKLKLKGKYRTHRVKRVTSRRFGTWRT